MGAVKGLLVMSYTPESIMIHKPLASSLCWATSAVVYWADMIMAGGGVFFFSIFYPLLMGMKRPGEWLVGSSS